MKNELPQNWVIDTQAEKDSPLMSKFMEWFEKNINTKPTESKRYLGAYGNKISNWILNGGEFETITLEQWNAFYFPEWEPKQGDRVLVRDSDYDKWEERIFVVYHKEVFFVEHENDTELLVGWNFAKPLPKESILQPLVDQLKAEAKKLGIKDVKITFE